MAQVSKTELTQNQGVSDDTPHLLSRREGTVLWLTLNRPNQRNPLSSSMIAALTGAITEAADDPQVRVIVLSALGPVFCAGHDLREMRAREGEDQAARAARVRDILNACARMMLSIVHSPKAVIASVQGTASAAGCQLVSACDMAIASEESGFCTPGVNIGTFCTTPLVGVGRSMHRKHAMELALTGDLMSAENAVRIGLVNKVVPSSMLVEQVSALASKIASKSARAIRDGKAVFYRQIDMPLEQAFEYATDAMVEQIMSAESEEGCRAFLEKRIPRWEDAGP
ncbi:MAG: enoyl-CoA hydratase [Pseudomonadota bacterium]